MPARCWDARSKVSDYVDDDLPASDRLLVGRHLETCPTCPPLYAGLVGARAALGALRDADTGVPTSLADRINEAAHPRVTSGLAGVEVVGIVVPSGSMAHG